MPLTAMGKMSPYNAGGKFAIIAVPRGRTGTEGRALKARTMAHTGRFILGRTSARRVAVLAAIVTVLGLLGCAGDSDHGQMTADRARRVLSAQGYTELHDLRPDHGGFVAQALSDGKPVTVVIDSYGIIHTR